MRYLVLENIRSAHNVGSIFRTADGAGVSKIFIVGHTPAPVDRFGRVPAELAKTSLGAIDTVSWEYTETTTAAIAYLPAGTPLVAIEQHEQALPLSQFAVPTSVCYVLGNEVTGVADATLERADTIVELPMQGTKESLNVAVTAGIVLYHGLVA